MAEATSDDPLGALERRLGADWTSLRAARAVSREKTAADQQIAAGLDSGDTSIVVLGSLARDEFTSGSDMLRARRIVCD